jgi:hypothetical protein
MQPRITVQPAPKGESGWIVAFENDPTPIGRAETREQAEIDARETAREMGQAEIIVYGADGEIDYQQFDPEFPGPPTVKDVKGPSLS